MDWTVAIALVSDARDFTPTLTLPLKGEGIFLPYRLVYCGARRARLRPYFLLSLMRASRVT